MDEEHDGKLVSRRQIVGWSVDVEIQALLVYLMVEKQATWLVAYTRHTCHHLTCPDMLLCDVSRHSSRDVSWNDAM